MTQTFERCRRHASVIVGKHTPPHSEAACDIFKDAHNSLKKLIGKAKRRFITNALLYKRPNEVWKTIHCILHPSQQPITVYPDDKHFASAAECVDASVGTLRYNDADGKILFLFLSLDQGQSKFGFRRVCLHLTK